jgi:hypothetical protein
MDEMVRISPEDAQALAWQMKLANTARIKDMVDALEPYCDGSLGAVSPPHVNSRLKAIRELGLLWHTYDRPAEKAEDVKGVDEEPLVLEARQAQALSELTKLREISRRRGV